MPVIAAMGPAKTYFCTFVNAQEIFPVFVKNSHCGEGEYSRKQQAAGKGHIGRDNQHRGYRAHHYIVAYQSDQYTISKTIRANFQLRARVIPR